MIGDANESDFLLVLYEYYSTRTQYRYSLFQYTYRTVLAGLPLTLTSTNSVVYLYSNRGRARGSPSILPRSILQDLISL